MQTIEILFSKNSMKLPKLSMDISEIELKPIHNKHAINPSREVYQEVQIVRVVRSE